jgi:hypothetical protein
VSSFLLAVPSEVLFRINLNVLYIYIHAATRRATHLPNRHGEKGPDGFQRLGIIVLFNGNTNVSCLFGSLHTTAYLPYLYLIHLDLSDFRPGTLPFVHATLAPLEMRASEVELANVMLV